MVSVGGVMAGMEQKLFDAVRAGDVPVMKMLIERGGTNVNQRDDEGVTLLHYASYFGKVEAVGTLAELGADKDDLAVERACGRERVCEGGASCRVVGGVRYHPLTHVPPMA